MVPRPRRRRVCIGLGKGSAHCAPAPTHFEGLCEPEPCKSRLNATNGEFDSPIARTHRTERELANFKSVVLPGKSHLTAIMAGYMPQQYLDELRKFINANDPE